MPSRPLTPVHSNRRYIMNGTRKLVIEQRPYVQDIDHKPQGLWYALGREWIEWSRQGGSMRRLRGTFLHEIEVDRSRIIILNTAKKLRAFHATYGAEFIRGHSYIDWRKVERTGVAGIEIAPYRHESRLDFSMPWYYGWDVASGCVWDVSAIRAVQRVTNWRR